MYFETGKVLEWLKRHAWKACIPLKGIGGSNPPLSAFIYIIKYMKKNTAIARFAILVFTWMCSLPMMAQEENMGFHQALKTKFIEGNAGFMSLVAIALIVGMAFCIERIIYLSLSEINAKKLMQDIDQKVAAGDVEGAKTLCRNTRGPVASICYQGLMHISESLDDIERSVSGYGTVQAANLEKGCSWIKLFIAMAPSLGFLGTVIGMIKSFAALANAGSPDSVALSAGISEALVNTAFGIATGALAVISYNYFTSKIDKLTYSIDEVGFTIVQTYAATHK